MRQFYETWCPNVFRQPVAGELKEYDNEPIIIRQPVAGELQLTPSRLDFSRDVFDIELAHDFLSISFTHHMEILNKTNTLEQRLFYIQKSAEF